MQVIWKYDVTDGDVFEHEMPLGATILSVGRQGKKGVFWALVNPSADKETRKFRLIGTGWDIPDIPLSYLGTYQDGFLVWHLFEERQGEE